MTGNLEDTIAGRHPSVAGVARWLVPNPNLPAGPPADVAAQYAAILAALLELVPEDSPELTVAIRKLLESKDAAVRAALGG